MRKSSALLFMVLLVVASVFLANKAVSQAGTSSVKLQPKLTGGKFLHGVDTVYPPIAKAAGVQGTVVLEAVIGKDGLLNSITVVSGPPMLQQAAIDDVKQWEYQPYLLDGKPVEVKTTPKVVFSLGDTDAGAASSRLSSQAASAEPKHYVESKPHEIEADSRSARPSIKVASPVGSLSEKLALADAERVAASQERLSPQQLDTVYRHASDARARGGFIQADNDNLKTLSEALTLYPKLLNDLAPAKRIP